uniref:Uncharacterized protein n=1 Tax=Micrurus spixii TaxID=129469 RepID=A0A2D4N727_9SAUR
MCFNDVFLASLWKGSGLHTLLFCPFLGLHLLGRRESMMVQMSVCGSCTVKFVQSLKTKTYKTGEEKSVQLFFSWTTLKQACSMYSVLLALSQANALSFQLLIEFM